MIWVAILKAQNPYFAVTGFVATRLVRREHIAARM